MQTAKPKPKTGRPSKFAPDTAAVVLAHVRRGSPRHVAANAAGLGRSTLMRWLARGKKERRGHFRDFWDALKKAEAELVIELVERITAAAERGTWQAAAWTLERRHPEQFSTHVKELAALRKEVVELRLKILPEETQPKSKLTDLLEKILHDQTTMAKAGVALLSQQPPDLEAETKHT